MGLSNTGGFPELVCRATHSCGHVSSMHFIGPVKHRVDLGDFSLKRWGVGKSLTLRKALVGVPVLTKLRGLQVPMVLGIGRPPSRQFPGGLGAPFHECQPREACRGCPPYAPSKQLPGVREKDHRTDRTFSLVYGLFFLSTPPNFPKTLLLWTFGKYFLRDYSSRKASVPGGHKDTLKQFSFFFPFFVCFFLQFLCILHGQEGILRPPSFFISPAPP